MENPSGKENEAPVATPEPSTPPSEPVVPPTQGTNPPTPETTPAPSESTPTAPTPAPLGRPAPDRIRTNVKVAGGVMVLLGALILGGAAMAILSPGFPDSRIDEFSSDAQLQKEKGGNVTVEVLGSSNVTVEVYNLTGQLLSTHHTNASQLTFASPSLFVRTEIHSGGQNWTRKVFATPRDNTLVQIEPVSPVTQDGWVQTSQSFSVGDWAIMGAVGLFFLAGIGIFFLRAWRLAITGAFVFLAFTLLRLIATGLAFGLKFSFIFEPLLYAGMAVFCVWAVRRGRDRFQPLKLGSIQL